MTMPAKSPEITANDPSMGIESSALLGEVWLVWQHDPHYMGGDSLLRAFAREFEACLYSEQRNEQEEDSQSYYVTRLPVILPNAIALPQAGRNQTPTP